MKSKYIGRFMIGSLIIYGAVTIYGIFPEHLMSYQIPWFWCTKYTAILVAYIISLIMTVIPYKGNKRKENDTSFTSFGLIAVHTITAAIWWSLCVEKDFEGLIVLVAIILGLLLPVLETLDIVITRCDEKVSPFQAKVDYKIRENEKNEKLESKKQQAIHEIKKIKPLYDRKDFFDDGDN